MVLKALAVTKGVEALSLVELVRRYAVSNQADGKSPKTVEWYDEILRSFDAYTKAQLQCDDISSFSIDSVRDYILHLRHKPKFRGHPYTPEQGETVSPRTVQCHVRGLKAFSSWLHMEGYTTENILKNLKLPKAPAEFVRLNRIQPGTKVPVTANHLLKVIPHAETD